jgi:competence protein ComEA
MLIKKTLALLLSLATTLAMAAVDVNTASEADLDSVKGIGPGTSSKMLEQRKAGKFKDWPDLIARVPGIGDKRAAKLSAEGLTVNGAKYQPAVTETPAPKAKAPAPTKP